MDAEEAKRQYVALLDKVPLLRRHVFCLSNSDSYIVIPSSKGSLDLHPRNTPLVRLSTPAVNCPSADLPNGSCASSRHSRTGRTTPH